jgi:hypothetical protein
MHNQELLLVDCSVANSEQGFYLVSLQRILIGRCSPAGTQWCKYVLVCEHPHAASGPQVYMKISNDIPVYCFLKQYSLKNYSIACNLQDNLLIKTQF